MNSTAHACEGSCGIDIHAHVVPEHFPHYMGSTLPAEWPSMQAADACHRSMVIAGKNYRTVSDKCWDIPKRIADFSAMQLQLQLVSPMPELLSYWLPAAAAQQFLRYTNDQIGQMIGQSQGRLRGLGAVPLQDLDMALRELEYCMGLPGIVGVEIGSNINGRPVGAPEFDGFFAACVELNAAVFVHALRPAGMERLIGPAPLQQVLAYPGDVGLAAASVLTGNLMLRHPRLRIAFSHGGGTLAMLLPRLQQGWKVFPALQESMSCSPVEQARMLFYDTLVFDPATLGYLVECLGRTQLMIGTDYPFNFHQSNPVTAIKSAGFDEETLHLLAHGNATRYMGLAHEDIFAALEPAHLAATP